MSRPASERLSAPRVLAHLLVMVSVAAVLGVLTAGLAIPFAGMAGLGAKSVASGMDNLPAELTVNPLAQQTRLVDPDGNVIATLYDENRIYVPLSQISRTMVKAIVAIEDYRFYQHGALDLKGTLRALITNQANSGAVVQGGSSITQQMVKLTLLSQAKTKKQQRAATADTYARKLRELRYAIAFEQKYSKDWILERYLNIAYFGDGAYGIQAAARHYFNTNAKDLTLPQAAMLAGLVKNPTGYDPTNYADRAIERRNVVLDRMAQLNVITQQRADKVKAEKLGLDPVPTPNGCVYSRAPFFCDYAINYLLHDPQLGKTVKERKQLLYTGGLTIHTTVSLRDQKAADASVAHHLYPTDHAIGALAMVEPRTGNVKAIAQSRPMGANKKVGQTYLNYVVPQKYGDSNGFQAGSTFKAFVLASAIDQKIPLNTRINAPQQVHIPVSQYRGCTGHFLSSEVWSPQNSTGSGTFNLYTGTQQSVNTFFAQLELRTGLCEPYRLAREMGVELTDPTRERVPSFTLGVGSVSPLEMAEAYATFAGRGLHCDSRPVTSIEDSNGNLLRTYPSKCQQVISAPVADAVNDVLRGVQEPGGFGYDAGISLNQPSAGKTGTTDANRAVWFIGYTPNLAAASMIAGANSLGQWITLNGQSLHGVYIDSAHGSTTAGPMWGEAMQKIQAWLPDTPFTAPDVNDIAGVVTSVPSVGGMSVQQATQVLQNAGFTVTVGSSDYSSYPSGTVAYTLPGSGASVASGTTVTLVTSNGIAAPPPPKHHKNPQPTNPNPNPNPGPGNGHGHGNGQH